MFQAPLPSIYPSILFCRYWKWYMVWLDRQHIHLWGSSTIVTIAIVIIIIVSRLVMEREMVSGRAERERRGFTHSVKNIIAVIIWILWQYFHVSLFMCLVFVLLSVYLSFYELLFVARICGNTYPTVPCLSLLLFTTLLSYGSLAIHSFCALGKWQINILVWPN